MSPGNLPVGAAMPVEAKLGRETRKRNSEDKLGHVFNSSFSAAIQMAAAWSALPEPCAGDAKSCAAKRASVCHIGFALALSLWKFAMPVAQFVLCMQSLVLEFAFWEEEGFLPH